jgi:hypothetical protein
MIATLCPMARLFGLAALCLVAGWLMPWPTTDRPERLSADDALDSLLQTTWRGVIALSVAGILLAVLGLFRPAALLALALAALVARVWFLRRQETALWRQAFPSTRSLLTWRVAATLAAFCALAWLYARPAEAFLLIDDASVYTLGGLALARTGWLWTKLDAVWPVTADLQRSLFQFNPSGMVTRHFGSFYQYTFGQQVLEIGFLPLPKVWAAISVWLFGAPWAGLGAPLFGVLSVATFWRLARRSLGRWGGAVAAIALAIALPEVWYAHYPISEIYAQALVVAGLWLLGQAYTAADQASARPLAIASALALALLTLVRFEAALMLAPLAAAVWWLAKARHPRADRLPRIWLITLCAATIVGGGFALVTSRYYLFDQTLGTASPRAMRLLLALLLAVLALAALTIRARRRYPLPFQRTGELLRRHPRRGAALAWAPALAVGLIHGLTTPWGTSLPHWLVQYLTPSGLALALAGLLLYLLARPNEEDGSLDIALLLAAAPFAALYALRPMVVPVHPWALRRLVPLVLPALALGWGALAQAGQRLVQRLRQTSPAPRRPWLAAAALVVLTMAQLLLLWRVTAPLAAHREMAGLWEDLAALDRLLPPNAVVLCDNGDLGHALAPTIELALDRPTLALTAPRDDHDRAVIAGLLAAAQAQGRPAVLIYTDGDLVWGVPGWGLRPYGAQVWHLPRLGRVVGRPPTAGDLSLAQLSLDIYALVPSAETAQPAGATGLFELPLASGSRPYLASGFYPAEDADGQAFRWTADKSELALPWPSQASPATFCLRLHLAGGRPPDEPPAQLEVIAEGQRVYEVTLGYDYAPVVLDIPIASLSDIGEPGLELELQVNPWSPSNHGSADPRALGVALYGLTLATDCGALAP